MNRSFTGISRDRNRRVDLSGRQNRRNALDVAATKRIQRVRQNELLKGTLLFQRLRRGTICRRTANAARRRAIDAALEKDDGGQSLFHQGHLWSLSRFIDPARREDVERLQKIVGALRAKEASPECLPRHRSSAIVNLHRRILQLITMSKQGRLTREPGVVDSLSDQTVATAILAIRNLKELTCLYYDVVAVNSDLYYSTLASVLRHVLTQSEAGFRPTGLITCILDAAKSPLLAVSPAVRSGDIDSSRQTVEDRSLHRYYTSFSLQFLSKMEVAETAFQKTWLRSLSDGLDCRLLTSSLCQSSEDQDSWDPSESPGLPCSPLSSTRLLSLTVDQRFSLLGFIIFFHTQSPLPISTRLCAQFEYVEVLTTLLLSIIEHPLSFSTQMKYFGETDVIQGPALNKTQRAHCDFVQAQLELLIAQHQIQALFNVPLLAVLSARAKGKGNALPENASIDSDPSPSSRMTASDCTVNRQFATRVAYVLALISHFPSQGDQIRTWLFLVESPYIDRFGTQKTVALTRILSEIALNTDICEQIVQNPRAVVDVLGLTTQSAHVDRIKTDNNNSTNVWQWSQDEWRMMILFLEAYSFVAKIVDDNQFRSGQGSNDKASRTLANRSAIIPLADVSKLAAFIRNLTFSLYFHASEILAVLPPVHPAAWTSTSEHVSPKRVAAMTAFVDGLRFGYVRGVVIGLTRTIHDRDSRWQFLPDGFWLMNRYFNMDGFIPDVVAEEERRQWNFGADSDEEDWGAYPGTTHHSRARIESLASKIAPRLDILENVPFFIPFETRVAIFRECISVDRGRVRKPHPIGAGIQSMFRPRQRNTRNIDRELFGGWRQSRPAAQVRRGYEFEDALSQFVGTSDDFRNPFLIEFVDKFQIQEAGIDGGGVTKEFLLAAITQAIEDPAGPPLFVETSNHLLYPNPTIIQELRDEPTAYRDEYDMVEESPSEDVGKTVVSAALLRYELLGLLVGKCLYDGILINHEFAGFFLLKWALAGTNRGGIGEGGYRPNINDLRELDGDIYQSLLKIQNYSGDVTDLCLSFVASYDVPNRITGRSRKEEVPLCPDGASMEVTDSKRFQYISLMSRHLLHQQQHAQTAAFLRGLSRLIVPSWLGMFNRAELRMLVGGVSGTTVDLADLRRNTFYSGLYQIGDDGKEHETIKMFWTVLETAPESVRRRVVQFVTSSPRAPLLGFGQLNPPFTIRDSGNDQTRLPSASTCVNLLKLPVYRSEEVLRRKLFAAAESGAGFDLS